LADLTLSWPVSYGGVGDQLEHLQIAWRWLQKEKHRDIREIREH
jgi:hypothetical protein